MNFTAEIVPLVAAGDFRGNHLGNQTNRTSPFCPMIIPFKPIWHDIHGIRPTFFNLTLKSPQEKNGFWVIWKKTK
jgi:hypothetical protein